MAVSGRKPRENRDQIRHRVPPRHDWVEVEAVPYTDRPPVSLPKSLRTIVTKEGDTVDLPVHKLTRAWWRRIRAMPHCVLWSESDWQFALETALVADAMFYGAATRATELRQREKVLGTTVDARRDLRIRYIDPPEDDVGDGGEKVARMSDYRDL